MLLFVFGTSAFAACAQSPPAPAPAANATSSSGVVPADARAGSSGAGRVGDPPVLLDPISLVGTWSFDRTCASEDGMTLNADGTAGTDQGRGMWAVDPGREKLIIIVREQEMGQDEDPLAERHVWTITATKPVGDDLVGRLDPRRAGEAPVALNARRCPATR